MEPISVPNVQIRKKAEYYKITESQFADYLVYLSNIGLIEGEMSVELAKEDAPP